MLKFYWNGIKDSGGKLQTCHYSIGALSHHPENTITIYSREYTPLSAGIKAAFTVENKSDSMTDYFEKDIIRVLPDHPLYAQVFVAMQAQDAHNKRRAAKWNERHGIAA